MVSSPDTTTTTAAAKPTLVIDGMDSRRIFDNTDDAIAYLNASADKFSDFDSHAQVLNGLDAEGNFLDSVYTPDTRVMVCVLANRGEKKGDPSTVKAIVVTPIPTIDAILNDTAGREWAARILEKELNHVAVRPLRTADDVTTVADQMPLTLAQFVTSSRESSGGIMEAFNAYFKDITAALAAKSPAWAKRRFTKAELKKSFESKAYALEYYPEIEDRGTSKKGEPLQSMFVIGLTGGIALAKKGGQDPAIFEKWLAERDSRVLAKSETDDDADAEDFGLDDLAFEAAPTAETTPAQPTADATA